MVIAKALASWDRGEALIMLEHITGLSRTQLITEPSQALSEEEEEVFEAMVERRREGYPLQYLIGKWAFYDFEVFVESGVLIPRSETELLVEEALALLEDGDRVLEIGTGTGIISIALARHRDLDITATDISDQALALAEKNASYNGVDIDFVKSDLYDKVKGSYDMIISNPPYIKEEDRAGLARELSHEPDEALFAGRDGLEIIEKILAGAASYLEPGGHVLLEFAYDQGARVKSLFKEHGFRDIMIKKDYNKQDRIGKGCL